MKKSEDIKIGEYTLKEIIKRHHQWIITKGVEGMMADLSYADLENVDLRGVDLRGAKLYCANLSDANLSGAELRGANLNGANLNFADLSDVNLRCAKLYDTKLYGAELRGADLSYAELRGADLHDADLIYTKLSGADLRGANLYGSYLRGAKGNLMEYRRGKILTESIIGYKKCRGDVIVRLEIPRGAVVFSINGNKCRTNKAKVISIDGADRAYSNYHYMNMTKYMSYYVGDEINIKDFDCQYNVECAKGIHFFMTREEAEKYLYKLMKLI